MGAKFKMAWAFVAIALVAALVVPTMALAETTGPPAGSDTPTASVVPTTSVPATVTPVPHPSPKLIKRIRAMVKARKAWFNRDVVVLHKRINRLGAITFLAEKAGGDVSAIRPELAAARAHLSQARSLEATAIAKLKAVPYAADPKAALADARVALKAATKALNEARREKREAARDLWALIKHLRMTSKVSTRDFK